jgi:hypothetical protein
MLVQFTMFKGRVFVRKNVMENRVLLTRRIAVTTSVLEAAPELHQVIASCAKNLRSKTIPLQINMVSFACRRVLRQPTR